MNEPLKIGVLNLMHKKLETKQDFTTVLTQTDHPVELSFFYPTMHYQNTPVPKDVSDILQPLDLDLVRQMDGFIITGSPIETMPFEKVHYINEIYQLLAVLAEEGIEQLYVCWGAMAALNYFYQISKGNLPEKLFGVYPHQIYNDKGLLKRFLPNFLAPHARYAEMNKSEILANDELTLSAETHNGNLFLVESNTQPQTFLFSHLEYGQQGLLSEYNREVAAHPERFYKKPENYFESDFNSSVPEHYWENTQNLFFNQWILKAIQTKINRRVLL